MNRIILLFVMTLIGTSACQANIQVVMTPTIRSQVSGATSTPTIVVTPTSSATPTVIPTNTPLFYSTPFSLPSDVISPENIEGMHELAVFGKGKVNNFSFSPDGKSLAVATMRGIYLYDGHTFIEKKFIPTNDSVNCIVFSPDGKLLASTFSKGSVQLWQASNGTLLDIFENNTGFPSGSVLFSPDGSILFSGSADAAVRAWQVSDGKLIHTFRGSRAYSEQQMVNSISISPDGSLLATTDGYERVWIWRVSTGELVHRLEGNHVAFSPDGKVLAVNKGYYSDTLLVMLWQVSDWTLINTLSGHKGSILSMNFSPDGDTILINDTWREAKLWNISDQSISMCFQCGQKNFDFLFFSPDGSTITTLDWDGVLQIWSMLDGELLHTFNEHLGSIPSLAFSPDGTFLAASSASSVSLWRISDSTLLNLSIFKSHNAVFSQKMVFSRDNKLLAFGPYAGGLHLWEINHPNSVLVLNDNQTVSSLAFSSNGSILAIGWEFGRIVEFRQVSDGVLLGTLEIDGIANATTLAYSPDDEFLAVGRYESVEIWRLSDKTLVHSFRRYGSSIDQVRFSPNGNVSITGQTTAQWSGTDGKQLKSFYIRGDTFSPDTNLVAGIQSNKLHFFRMEDGKLIKTLRLNIFIQDVIFSADGKLMALAGHDGTISIWGISPQ